MNTTSEHNYELINLEDYTQSGEGGMALTYSHKDGKTLAKLFMKGMGAETAEREFLVNKSGKIQTGSSSGKKYTDSSEGIVWTVVKESSGVYTITSEDKD